jgi:hypothetical protein
MTINLKIKIIILIVIFFIFFKYLNNYEKFENNKTYAVLLTTCIKPTIESFQNNSIERKKTYENSIIQWMEKTNLIIYIIESSNLGFPEIEERYKHTNRLHIIKYDQSQIKCDYNDGLCRGFFEGYSIKYALENMPKYDYILKVTGRYYLDGVENDLIEILKNDNLKDSYFQIHKTENSQNSEYFFIKQDNLLIFSNKLIKNTDKQFEESLSDYKNNITYSTLGPYQNYIKKGGDGTLINLI